MMSFNVDRLIALAAIILAIPSAILLFTSEHIATGIMMAVIIIILAIVWYLNNRQSFTILNVEKKLEIHDDKGSSATLIRHQKTRANHNGLTEFWCSRSISGDGSIKNILIDGNPPHEITKDSGDIQVCMKFKRPKKAGESFDFVLSLELENTFLESTEALIHVVEMETKKLRLIVEFPSTRIPTIARIILRYGGNPYKELGQIEIVGGKIEYEIKRPRLGAEYCLEWDW